MKGKILIIEDETKLSEVMSLYLKKENYTVTTVSDGREAEDLINSDSFDLIILDVMLPGKDGWALLRKIKTKDNTPVILTTARGEEDDRIFGLELGADDYMVKPISMRELVLRVNLRINSKVNILKSLSFNNLSVLEDSREVIEDGQSISLTPKEFDLLLFLGKNPGQVFNREQLLSTVWGYDFIGDSRTIDTHIKKLREKIKFCEEHLATVWGIGYKFDLKQEINNG
ncbi:response regulator transcription factor [Clostridium swellfunianum]|uniref:response regulator transcription factor n=1 Tax=Clostridium swellfunianum TaxID=1367462 RepID=UPI00202EF4F7|nr:response regulator transcription factor [Clostridium swellfunianum]MCM0650696.1 response regulator transcription factor [Clostridium swellfunianum]